VAKWQQWRRADQDRLAGKNRNESGGRTCLFRTPCGSGFFWPSATRSCSRGFGVRSPHETDEIAALTDPGAPVAPRLAGNAIWSTLILVAGFAALVAFTDHAG